MNGGDPTLAASTPRPPRDSGTVAREAPFDKVLPLAAAPDGATRLDFLARNGAGVETRILRFINKDTVPPPSRRWSLPPAKR